MIHLQQMFCSFKHALRGVKLVFVSEQSFRVQVLAAIFVIALGFVFGVTKNEWIVLLILIGAVTSLELLNSILERIVDTFKPRIHPAVKDIKDAMAGTVLIVSFIAAVIGITIFLPHVLVFIGEFDTLNPSL
jgi:diacylglycerol kinase